jgi:hypothetical protein
MQQQKFKTPTEKLQQFTGTFLHPPISTCTSGAGSIISARRILTTSSNRSRISSSSTSDSIRRISPQNSSRTSSHPSTNRAITFGFCPGAGRIFSGKLAIP